MNMQKGPRARSALSAETLALVALLVATLVVHGWNMFSYPYFENDEGTYVAQSWAVLHLGRLAPYTYWYDHSPVGWLQLAVLTGIGQLFPFWPNGIPGGRLLMLGYQLGSTALVYVATRRSTGNWMVALAAAAVFVASPWGTYYHRRVLLDNIATFWLLAGLTFLTAPRLRPLECWGAALSLGIAVLSKEVVIVVLPAVLAWIYVSSEGRVKLVNVGSFIALAGGTILAFPLFAVLKGELLPPAAGAARHVSLLCTALFQASRGKDGGLFSPTSQFWQYVRGWTAEEPVLIIGGTLAALALLFFRQRFGVLVALCLLSLWAFLARGGLIITFYLVPLLPLMAISLAMAVWSIIIRLVGTTRVAMAGGLVMLVATSLVGVNIAATHDAGSKLFQNHEADALAQAVAWVGDNVPVDSRLVIDQAFWPSFHADPSQPGRVAHYYWKVEKDPDISALYGNDWRNIDILVVTPQMTYDVQQGANGMTLLAAALAHSRSLKTFDTGGWVVDIRKVDPAMTPEPFTVTAPPPQSAPAQTAFCAPGDVAGGP